MDRSTTAAASLLAVALIAGSCSETIECDAPEEDCSCESDGDCVVTDFLADVSGPDECYATDCVCAGPINRTAAERNEANHAAQGCDEIADDGCDVCSDVLATPMCKDHRCVQVTTVGGPRQDVTAPL